FIARNYDPGNRGQYCDGGVSTPVNLSDVNGESSGRISLFSSSLEPACQRQAPAGMLALPAARSRALSRPMALRAIQSPFSRKNCCGRVRGFVQALAEPEMFVNV